VSTTAAAILVVDDNEDNRYTLTRRLRRQGFDDLTEAASGREALEQIAGRPFDLVLLDVMMPEMNGYEVLEHLKRDDGLRHIPVIMISALSELDSVVRCIELGAEDYLPKPFNAVLLNARISASLERKRLHDREHAHLAEIDRQRQRADELLHAMLPQPAVAELKSRDRIAPRRFDDVMVRSLAGPAELRVDFAASLPTRILHIREVNLRFISGGEDVAVDQVVLFLLGFSRRDKLLIDGQALEISFSDGGGVVGDAVLDPCGG